MLQGLQFVLMHVPSVAQVETFYAQQLGFTVEDRQPGFVQYKQPNGATFAISEDSTVVPGGGVELWWFVDDADAACAELAERGVPIASPPADQPFGRTFSINDPAGNTLYMLQLARTPSAPANQ